MKKKIAIIFIMTLALSMNSCSNPNNSKEDSNVDIQKTDNVSKEETTKTVIKEYSGLSFEIPSDAEYSEDASCATITFEPKMKAAVIVPTNTSELDASLSDVWYTLAISSALDGYEDVQNRKDFDMTVSEVPAKAATATVKLSDSWYSLTVISFINETSQYQYSISYLVSENADEDNSDYEAFIKSITFS